MKKTAHLLLLVVMTNFAFAGVGTVIHVPGHAKSITVASISPTTTITDTFTNTDKASLVLNPVVAGGNLGTITTNHTAWLMGQVDPNADLQTRKWQVLKAEYWFVKSIYRTNGMLVPASSNGQNSDSLNTMLYGANCWVALPFMQCGNSARLFAYDILQTGLFNQGDSITMLDFTGKHSILQMYEGAWYVFDCDPAEPGAISKGSIWDLMRNHALIQQYRYPAAWGDSMNLCPLKSMTAYYSLLDSAVLVVNPLDITRLVPTHNLSTNWIMYPNEKIIWSWTPGYVIDTTTTEGRNAFQTFTQNVSTGNQNSAYAGFAALGAIIHQPITDSVVAYYSSDRIHLIGGNHWWPIYRATLPKVEIDVQTQNDTLWIGSDAAFPGTITDIYTSHSLMLPRGYIVNDSIHFNLWNYRNQIQVDYRAFQFLDGGFFIPPHTTLKVYCTLNTRAYDFIHGFDFEQISSGGSLAITGDSTLEQLLDTTITTGVASIDKTGVFKLFPNPAYGTIFVQGAHQYAIYALDGRKMQVFEFQDELTHELDLSMYSSGIYLLSDGVTTSKFVLIK